LILSIESAIAMKRFSYTSCQKSCPVGRSRIQSFRRKPESRKDWFTPYSGQGLDRGLRRGDEWQHAITFGKCSTSGQRMSLRAERSNLPSFPWKRESRGRIAMRPYSGIATALRPRNDKSGSCVTEAWHPNETMSRVRAGFKNAADWKATIACNRN
jgi:hypothetical protein